MKTIIFYTSTHHGNTAKVAKVIGEVLKADMHDLEKEEGASVDIRKADLIGLGSGVYGFNLSEKLFALADQLDLTGKKVFLFSTSSSNRIKLLKKLKDKLAEKKVEVVGEFMCLGFVDWAFFKWFGGGLRKGHPNAEDLENVRKFAESLKK
jgi:flavodoxin